MNLLDQLSAYIPPLKSAEYKRRSDALSQRVMPQDAPPSEALTNFIASLVSGTATPALKAVQGQPVQAQDVLQGMLQETPTSYVDVLTKVAPKIQAFLPENVNLNQGMMPFWGGVLDMVADPTNLVGAGMIGGIKKVAPKVAQNAEAKATKLIQSVTPDRILTDASIIKNKVPQQGIVSQLEARKWLSDRDLMPESKNWNPKSNIDTMVSHPDFQQLPIFDKARVMAVLERPGRQKEYEPVKILGDRNTKQQGSSIYEVDTIKGCDNECIECYALKGAAQAQITHNVPVKAKLMGKLPTDGITRFGVVGDSASDWEWSNKQIRSALDRTPGATPEKNIMFVTKLQNMTGFDPSIAKNLEITLDPIYPAHMKTTMENALKLKAQYPDTNMVFRIRTVASTNPDLQRSQQMAVDFVNALDLPILETRMRFIRKSTMDSLELDMSKYKKVGNQFKVKGPQLETSSKNYKLCDSGNVGCKGCNKCASLFTDVFSKPGIPLAAGAISAAGLILQNGLQGGYE